MSMSEASLIEISEIIDTFDMVEVVRLLNTQLSDLSFNTGDNSLDHFRPLYVAYKNLKDYDMTEDDRKEAEEKFYKICETFLKIICNKFDIMIDETFISENYNNLPAITLSIYVFFVVDIKKNISTVLNSYIQRNHKDLNRIFDSYRNKKDASSLVNKKVISAEYSLILSNIYEISEWILDNIDEEDFLEYSDQDYLPLQFIKDLFDENVISGTFAEKIAEIFKTELSMKSQICFDIILNGRTTQQPEVIESE